MNTSRECAGMARRRSPRLHPQIQAIEEGAGVTCRRSPRLNRPIQDSESGARRIRRRRRTSPAGPSCMPDDDDMLREILIRLPPEPSSPPRASAVCKRWLGLVTDPKFHHQFFAHHRKPPLLGVFSWDNDKGIVFNSILDPPDRIPHERFSVARYWSNEMLDCRHGRVLLVDCHWKKMVLVCDPITGEQRRVAFPSEFQSTFFQGAVVCAAGNQGHVHGGCHSSPFKGLSVIMGTPFTNDFRRGSRQIIRAKDGAVGFAVLSYPRFQTWQRNINGHGLATWVPWKIVEMDSIVGFPPQIEGVMGWMDIIQGYEEDIDVIFLIGNDTTYMVQLKSMQSRKIYGSLNGRYHPFKSFYTLGDSSSFAIRECNEAAMLHNP
ncbi:unnamed protein product [Alopecurus aequalis]